MAPPALPLDSIYSAAATLGVEPAALRAVVQVESSGLGVFPAGSESPEGLYLAGLPVVRFEAHVFYKQLKLYGIDPAAAEPARSDLIRKAREDRLVKTSAGEWDRLTAARLIHRDAADGSASWGAFQIMGFNWKEAGAVDVQDFVRLSHSLQGQLELFVNLLKSWKGCLKALARKDWAGFARIYNGAGYAKNGYHLKLAREYAKALKG
jgi:hypothetical protein